MCQLWPIRVVCDTAKVRVFKQITTELVNHHLKKRLFAILQKYEFSSKSQRCCWLNFCRWRCLRYCKSTSFQANHNYGYGRYSQRDVVCDTAKVRVFKQITTKISDILSICCCLRYCKSTSFQANHNNHVQRPALLALFAILQKYEVSSESQLTPWGLSVLLSCLRYCKSTSFQANHNYYSDEMVLLTVVCDTAKVRVFKQITTIVLELRFEPWLFAILQKYEFSSKSQQQSQQPFQKNVVCDTAKVRVFKQLTTRVEKRYWVLLLFAILQKYEFSSKSQPSPWFSHIYLGCLRYCKSTSFQANHNQTTAIGSTFKVVCDTAKVRVFRQTTTKSLVVTNKVVSLQ